MYNVTCVTFEVFGMTVYLEGRAGKTVLLTSDKSKAQLWTVYPRTGYFKMKEEIQQGNFILDGVSPKIEEKFVPKWVLLKEGPEFSTLQYDPFKRNSMYGNSKVDWYNRTDFCFDSLAQAGEAQEEVGGLVVDFQKEILIITEK